VARLDGALAEAGPELRRSVFDAFRLSAAIDRNAGQIQLKALVSSAFEKAGDLRNWSLMGPSMRSSRLRFALVWWGVW
jgi:hypothetical protein